MVHNLTYTYDALGNRLTLVAAIAGTTTTYTYDNNNRLLSSNIATYTYDANGNTLSRTDAQGTTTYRYDFDNRLTEVEKPGGQLTTYRYNAEGQRLQTTSAATAVAYVVDPESLTSFSQVTSEYDAVTGAPIASYVYGDDLLSQQRAGTSSYYLYDSAGHTRMLADDLGAITDTYDYSAFGLELNSTGTTANAYRYSGERFDPESGFYHLRARYYVPEQGRFLTQDTFPGQVSNPISLHRYLYAFDNPITYDDPSGLISSFLVRQMITSAVANTLITAAVGFWQGRTPEQFAADVIIGATVGALTGAVGFGVNQIISNFASKIVSSGFFRLIIPMVKALVSTAGFYVQSKAQVAFGIIDSAPTGGELILVWVANSVFLIAVSAPFYERIVNKAQSVISESARRKMAITFDDVFTIIGAGRKD